MKLHAIDIAQKLRISLVAIVIGLGLIGFAYWRISVGISAADQRIASFQTASARVEHLTEAFAEARRLQAEYALSFSAESGRRFRAALDALASAREAAVGPAAAGKPDTLGQLIAGYLESGRTLDERVEELGHDADSGLQGQLREAVHGVETLLGQYDAPKLQVSMLTMRRHEKDFILRRDQKYADALGEEAMPFELLLQKASNIPEPRRAQIREMMQNYQGSFVAYAASRYGMDSEAQALDATAAQVLPALDAQRTRQQAALNGGRTQQAAERARMGVIFWATLLLVAIGMVGLLLLLHRAIVRPLDDAIAFAREIADDRLDGVLVARNPHDEIGALANALGQMQASLRQRIEGERRIARENARVRQALDAVAANVMVGDAEGVVVYANDALLDNFSGAGIETGELVGGNVDALDAQVGELFATAARTRTAQVAELGLGDTRFLLQLRPVINDGQLLGVAMEWQDRRLERVVEHEVSALVTRAAQGHLEHRIPTDGKSGFLRQLVDSINQLLASMQSRLAETTRVMGAFAHGDLRERMRGDHRGVYAQLRDSLDAAIGQVGGIVGGIQHAAAQVRASADEMASGTANLSERTERQASDVSEALALMASVSGAVEENIGRTRDSLAIAGAASDAARRGREVSTAAMGGMEHIRGSSRRIVEIVATVDSLAFQTNLLALNAAVEAARAGSHGRGFAVVAGEVRSLAQRSSDAAREIRGLVTGSLNEVESGARLVDSTVTTMQEILDRVQQVAEVMGDINTASGRQGQALDSLDRLLRQIGQSTEQNAALAEESSAAASSLLEQAGHLGEAARTFIVEEPAVGPAYADEASETLVRRLTVA